MFAEMPEAAVYCMPSGNVNPSDGVHHDDVGVVLGVGPGPGRQSPEKMMPPPSSVLVSTFELV